MDGRKLWRVNGMNVLAMNCSPVRNGATAEIECCDRLGLCAVENKNAAEQRKDEIIEFCKKIQPDS